MRGDPWAFGRGRWGDQNAEMCKPCVISRGQLLITHVHLIDALIRRQCPYLHITHHSPVKHGPWDGTQFDSTHLEVRKTPEVLMALSEALQYVIDRAEGFSVSDDEEDNRPLDDDDVDYESLWAEWQMIISGYIIGMFLYAIHESVRGYPLTSCPSNTATSKCQKHPYPLISFWRDFTVHQVTRSSCVYSVVQDLFNNALFFDWHHMELGSKNNR